MSDISTTRVKTFYNQEHARVVVSEICARCVQHVLYLLDSATGPNGSDEVEDAPDPETSRLYNEFREWFAPNVGATIQSMVVGPLLSRLSVDADGSAHIEDDIYQNYDVSRTAGNYNRMVARAKWLACEIPILIEQYGQLYEHEEVEALGLVNDVAGFDFDSPDTRDYIEQVLPDLERWNLFSQPGGRMLRGDASAIEEYRDSLEWSRDRVKELETETKNALEAEEITDDQRHVLEWEITKISAKIKKFDESRKSLIKRMEDLQEKLFDV